jgi:hypothetical protein
MREVHMQYIVNNTATEMYQIKIRVITRPEKTQNEGERKKKALNAGCNTCNNLKTNMLY